MAGQSVTVAASAADACPPALEVGERTKSDEKGEDLRKAWEQQLREFREKWHQEQSLKASSAGAPVQPLPDGVIPPNLTKKVEEMLETLKPYLDGVNTGGTVAGACGELRAPEEPKVKGQKTTEMKRVCKTLVQVVHWMGNLEKEGNKIVKSPEGGGEQYLRCVIGYEVLLRVLLPKYEVQQFMNVISDIMKKGGSEGKDKNGNAICPWVKLKDIGDKEGSIGSQVQAWLNAEKEKDGPDSIKHFSQIIAWSRPEKEEDKQKEMAARRARTCKSERIMDLLHAGASDPLHVLVDPLAKANHCIEKAEKDSKNGNVLCNRLTCIETYLKEKDKAAALAAAANAPTPAPAGGSPSPTVRRWGKRRRH